MANEKFPRKAEIREIVTFQNDPYFQTYDGIIKPDDTTLDQRGSGKSYRLYDELEKDCHLYSELSKRKKTITATPWNITPASEEPADIEVAEGLTAILKSFSFDKLSEDLLDAIIKGFSASEIVWKQEEGRIGIRKTRHIDQRRILFDEESAPRLKTITDLVKGIPLPERKIIIHRFEGKNDNPYGLGLGSKLFWPVFFKRKGFASFNILAERFGMPIPLGKYPAGAQTTDINKLINAMKAMREQMVIALPEGTMIELLKADVGASAVHPELLRYCDGEISKCLLGFSNASDAVGGSRAAEETRNGVSTLLSVDDADKLSETLNQSLMVWLTEFNYPGATPPKVYRIFEEQENLLERSQVDDRLVKMGLPISKKYFYDKYNIAPPADDEETVTPPAPSFGPSFSETSAKRELSQAQKSKIMLDYISTLLADESGPMVERRLNQVIALAESTKDPATFKKALDRLYKKGAPEFQEAIAKANFSGKLKGLTDAQSQGKK